MQTLKDTRGRKLKRLERGKLPRLLDLFSGCGGLTLGFHTAGFEPVAGVELDPPAVGSYARNFFRSDESALCAHSIPTDISLVDPEDLVGRYGLRGNANWPIDVIVGGPPCQAYARVGRAKLREVDEHPDAFRVDARGNLFLRYLEYVRVLQPLALVMENVPDALNYGGHNIAEEVCEVLGGLGYDCSYTLLNAAYYGVPQSRERMFLVAIHRRIDSRFRFPEPTHRVDLPRGYKGTRSVALKTLREYGPSGQLHFFSDTHFEDPPHVGADLPEAVSAEEALGDLPFLDAEGMLKRGELRRGAKRFVESRPYRNDVELGGYARLMREWPGFEASDGVKDHVIRYLPRDFKLFRKMKAGDQYPQLHRLATRMFNDAVERRRARGERLAPNSNAYVELKKSIIPPYDWRKFPNKWRKMERDKPARTLMAHLGKDSYSHIHYDSKQGRTISVREAARLQSFPDGFVFEGTINPGLRQIGNAVPPLMAYAIAREISRTLGIRRKRDIRKGYLI